MSKRDISLRPRYVAVAVDIWWKPKEHSRKKKHNKKVKWPGLVSCLMRHLQGAGITLTAADSPLSEIKGKEGNGRRFEVEAAQTM